MRYFGFDKPSFNVKRLGFAFSRFTPADLFKNGEQGVWFDPSDLTTMFQDVDGTESVTKDGDPVGLILDKSQGLFSGEYLDFDLLELNPEKTGDSGTLTHTNGAIIYDINSRNIENTLVVPYTIDKLYSVTLDIENLSSATIEIKPVGGGGGDPTLTVLGANEHLKGTFIYRATSNTELYFRTSSGKLKVNSVKIKEVKGNHAIQETASARPIYRTDGNLHWLEFDGVDDHLIAASVELSDSYYISQGIINASAANMDHIVDNATGETLVRKYSGNIFQMMGSSGIISIPMTEARGNNIVLTSNFAGSNSYIEHSGNERRGAVVPRIVNGLRIGGAFYSANLSGFLAINGNVVGDSKLKLQDYLGQRAGVTL